MEKTQITDNNKKKEKIINFTKTVLEVLGVVAVLSVAVIAPNAVMLFDQFGKEKKKFPKDKFQRNLYYLKNQGYAHIRKENDQEIIEITDKGKKKFLNYKLCELKIKKPTEWDNKWRIVVADVPEEKRIARNALRSVLKRIGFYQLQKSVWVHPYECENEVEYIKQLYELQSYIFFIIADNIKQDWKLKKFFNL